jgi:microcystin-dependent protein
MPLENASFINDLVSTNPAATDQMGQGYQQIQLIKAVLKAQFPNWTSAVLNSTQAQIDAVSSAFSSGVFTVPAGTTTGGQVNLTGLSTNNTLSVVNNAGVFNLNTLVQGGTTPTTLATLDATGNLTVKGVSNAPSGFFTGAANTTPVSWVGEIRIHGGSLASIPTGWHLCDGTNGTPDLRDKFVVGAGNSYAVSATGGQATHVLTAAEMPVHNHTATDAGHGHGIYDPGHNHNVNDPTHAHSVAAGISNTGNFSAGGSAPFPTGGQVATAAAYTGIYLSAAVTGIGIVAGYANIAVTNAGSGAAHENRPPYYALCYVMRIV